LVAVEVEGQTFVVIYDLAIAHLYIQSLHIRSDNSVQGASGSRL
jgi:hypothetical protein